MYRLSQTERQECLLPDLVHMHVSLQPSTDALGRHSHMSLSADSVSLYLVSAKAAELTL